MFVTRVTSSNNVSPSRGNNEVSGTPVRGDVVDLTDDATTSAASNHNGSVDAAPTAHGFVGNFPNQIRLLVRFDAHPDIRLRDCQ